jgi:prepilin-type N-terminal cleavage/methylation domain-containing protein
MLQQLRAARKNESGFTLIELLIVIVILGVLAAIVVFSVQGITDRGKNSACKADKETVITAAEAFAAQSPTGAYPASATDLIPAFMHGPMPTDVNVVWSSPTVVNGIGC